MCRGRQSLSKRPEGSLILLPSHRVSARVRNVAVNPVAGLGNPNRKRCHSAKVSFSGVFLCLKDNFMAAVRGRLRACRVPFTPVFQPAYSCHPLAWKRTWQLQLVNGASIMPHLTTPLAFHETGPAQHNHLLFSVTPNIPATDALHSASELLSAVACTLRHHLHRRPPSLPAMPRPARGQSHG